MSVSPRPAAPNRDGAQTAGELFFRRGSAIHAVALDRFEVRSITRLFDAGAAIRAYDVSRDGRFLINVPATSAEPKSITLVTNWTSPTQ